MSEIVTRFAPSPTGHLHIGGARTAIFSWLLARGNGGKFLLRIEDTDRARSNDEMTQAILDSMTWLGLDWDGEPVYQHANIDRHNEVIDALLESGHAYWCDCTPEQVEAMREKARSEGRNPKYDLSCRDKGLEAGPDRVVRFKTPLDGRVQYTDLVKGPMSVEVTEMDDMILRRADGMPVYNLAVVVDDHDMGVTNVIRGDDHVANTFKQILIYQAMGWDLPAFGHVPLIHGQDKKKLSKRHGARSTMEYQKDGFLADAVLNYLVRLGWSMGDQELFTREELLEHFTTDNLSKSPAAFDPEKLQWVNGQYMKEMDNSVLGALLKPFLAEAGYADVDDAMCATIAGMFKERSATLKAMAEECGFLLVADADLEYQAKPAKKAFKPEGLGYLAGYRDVIASIDPLTHDAAEAAFHSYLEENELKFKHLGPPLRVALSGMGGGPSLFDIIDALGKDTTMARIERALAEHAA